MASRAAPTLVLALLLAGALPAGAQQISSPYRFVDESQAVGVFAGYVFPDAGALELGGIGGPAFGVRYGIRVGGPFAIEGDASYLALSRAVVDTLRVPPDSAFAVVDTASLDLLLLTATLRFDLTGPRTWNRLMPYFAAVVGGVIDLSGEEAADREVPAEARFDFGTSFSGGVGAGVEWFPTDRFTIRLDGRNVLWKISTPEALLIRDTAAPDEEWTQNIVVSVGGSLRF